jgi:hypothetical protein
VTGVPYVVGSAGASDSSSDMLLIRYDPATGNRLVRTYHHRLGAEFDDGATSLAIGAAGSIFTTGFTADTAISGDDETLYYNRVTTLKYDSTLQLIWALDVPPMNHDAMETEPAPTGWAVVARADTAYVAAEGFRRESYGTDVLTTKYLPQGSGAWAQWARGQDDADDAGRAVGVSQTGDVYVAGAYTFDADNGTDFCLLKYDASGNLEFSVGYDGPFHGADEALALVLDDSGNAYVTGTSADSVGRSSIVTVKFSATGDRVWTHRFRTAGSVIGLGRAIALDPQGRLYVAGVVSNATTGADIAVLRYDAVTGDTIWTRLYDDGWGYNDEGNALALDKEGSVYVAGYATRPASGSDFCTLKYSSGGALLKTWFYDNGGSDAATGIAVDTTLGVYVAGTSGASGNNDAVLVKYEQSRWYDFGISRLLSLPSTAAYDTTLYPAAVVFAAESTAAETISVRLSIGDFYRDSTSIALAPGQTDTVEFVSWHVVQPGQHMAVCSLAVSDSNAANDRMDAGIYVPSGWYEMAAMPLAASASPQKNVRAGGWLAAFSDSGWVFGAKGYRSSEFYEYRPNVDKWSGTPPVPMLESIPPGAERKLPYSGSVGASDGHRYIYMVKGNNTRAFWRYDVSGDTWSALLDIPGTKRARAGTDLAYVGSGDSGYVYLLKGRTNEFYRFSTGSGQWETLDVAPVGTNSKWDKGSWIAFDDSNTVYAHKARYHELWAYNVATGTWGATQLPGVPLLNGRGKTKKSGDGGSAVWLDGGIYAFKGNNSQELWTYRPDSGSTWAELETIPQVGSAGRKKRVKNGGDVAVCGSVIYALKGNNTREFWRYVPVPTSSWSGSGGAFASSRGKSDRGGRDGETAITTGAGAETPRWSIDGKYCVFSRLDANGWSQIYRRGRLDTVELAITHDSTDHERPVFDAQGKRIAMQVLDTVTGYYQIARAKVEANATVMMLTDDSCDNVMPEWRPWNGSRIVYEKDMDECSHIFMVDTLGTTETQLTTDEADHYEPSWVNDSIICYIWSPDDDYDQVAKVNVNLAAHPQTVLTTAETDHDNVNPSANGQKLAFEVTDAYGTQQIGCILTTGLSEAALTSGTTDKTEPDWSASGNAIYCANWTGITSQIGWVNPLSGLYTAVTDDDAIRDNVDVYYGYTPFTNNAIYEREECATGVLLKGDDGDGIYMVSQVEQEQDGQMGAGLRVLALDRAEPNPAASHVSIHWQLPAEAQVSLKVYNTAGQVVNTLVNGRQLPGAYTTIWDGTDVWGRSLAAGVYFYRLESDGKRLSRKVVLTGR